MTKPQIKLQQSMLPDNLDAAEQAMLDAGVPVYQAAGMLVHVVRIDDDQDSTHPRGSLAIRPLKPQRLVEYMMRAADFFLFNGKDWRPTAPTLAFAAAFMARGEWRLRVLRGIVEAPTLRRDGSVLADQGYDAQMQVVLNTGDVEFPPIPDRPSREDAMAALTALKDVISGFPFVEDEEPDEFGGYVSSARSVALSAILTSVSRKAMRTAPGHCIDAASANTGKTLLTDTIAVLATGRPIVPVSYGGSKAEFNKRMFSILMQGDPLVSIDNIDEELESDELCTIFTSEWWQNRILGESQSRQVSTAVLVMLNGNNIRVRGDLTSRVVSCRMDARMEDPGARVFDRDLRSYVPDHRPELVVAVLTMLRAFVVAGRPGVKQLSAMERFADWSNLVRGALVWLGEPDPLTTRKTIVAGDSEREGIAALHQAWADVIGYDKRMTAVEVMEASEQRTDRDLGIVGGKALEEVLGAAGVSAKVLGKWLVSLDGRIVDGRCLRRHATVGHSTRFWLTHAGQAGEAGQ